MQASIEAAKTRDELETICRARGIVHAWRDWAELVDVWLDHECLVELRPR